jgi:hypothetical protein
LISRQRVNVPRYVVPSIPCFRHCSGRARANTRVTGPPSGVWYYACRQGALALVGLACQNARGGIKALRRFLRSRLSPPSLASVQDIRVVTRHGWEFTPGGSRLGRGRRGFPVTIVYWRRYPWKRGGKVYRIWVCQRHPRGDVRFFSAPDSKTPRCPFPHSVADGRRGSSKRTTPRGSRA